jgi:hypothetical protein
VDPTDRIDGAELPEPEEPGSDARLSEDAQAYITEVEQRPEEEPPGALE